MVWIVKLLEIAVDRLLGTIAPRLSAPPPTPPSNDSAIAAIDRRKYRLVVLVALFASVPIGLGIKYYRGPLDEWLNNFVGGAIYEIFWMLFLVALFPRLKPAIAALAVFIATSILEFLQLWHPAWLEAFRRTFVGRTLLGTTFNVWDFPYYLLGCVLGWLLLVAFQKYTWRDR